MMLVLFWSNFSIFVSQMCFCFFFYLWFCQSSLGFRLLYNFLERFHSAQVSHHGCRGRPFAGPDFFKRPFLRATLGEALSQGHPFEATWGKGPSLSCSWKVQASSSSFFFLWSLGATLQAQAPICCCCWPHAILLAVAWLWA